ncbi:MAG: translation initiation factor IF-2 [Chloroflexi bacterium]|nr:translation initiation factor IF-2 [Chloroflexota bacterium]
MEVRDRSPVTAIAVGPVTIPPALTVKELAERLNVSPASVIRDLLQNGVIASINQTIDFDTAAIVAGDLGFEAREMDLASLAEPGAEEGTDETLVPRPAVVTVMGHVDHGKTSLLDAIRRTNVVSGEAGGITQHIGAYQVEVHDQKITFLDTPGHEAFTAMRARGASVTDVAILVVAADDGVMATTREAADHAKAAGVPIVVALNKIDRPGLNLDRVKQQLVDIGLVIEEFGGDTVCVPVSARTGEGLDTLLDMILVVAEMGNPRANPNRAATGAVIEARLDKARGPVATVLVQNGTLHVGDVVAAGVASGRIKALFNDKGRRIPAAEPATPVELLGLDEVPEAGDRFQTFADERTARLVAQGARRIVESRAVGARPAQTSDLVGGVPAPTTDLNLILKADVRGSLEAVLASIQNLSSQSQIQEEVRTKIVRADTGNVTESDVMLAAAAEGRIVAFNVRVEPGARRAADSQGVDIRLYGVIYHLIDDLERLMRGLLAPEYREVIDGQAEVRQVFKVGRNQAAGCYVTTGSVIRNSEARVVRKGQSIFAGRISSLKRFKDDVREVQTGYECGIGIDGFAGFEEGDVIETLSRELVSPVGPA